MIKCNPFTAITQHLDDDFKKLVMTAPDDEGQFLLWYYSALMGQLLREVKRTNAKLDWIFAVLIAFIFGLAAGAVVVMVHK